MYKEEKIRRLTALLTDMDLSIGKKQPFAIAAAMASHGVSFFNGSLRKVLIEDLGYIVELTAGATRKKIYGYSAKADALQVDDMAANLFAYMQDRMVEVNGTAVGTSDTQALAGQQGPVSLPMRQVNEEKQVLDDLDIALIKKGLRMVIDSDDVQQATRDFALATLEKLKDA